MNYFLTQHVSEDDSTISLSFVKKDDTIYLVINPNLFLYQTGS
jgi:hypothetical protein